VTDLTVISAPRAASRISRAGTTQARSPNSAEPNRGGFYLTLGALGASIGEVISSAGA
jgi:hypothetical protein